MAKVVVKGNVSGDVGRDLQRGSIIVKGNVAGRIGMFMRGGSVQVEDRMGKTRVTMSAGEQGPKEPVVIDGDIRGDLTIETTIEGKDIVRIDGDVLGNIHGGNGNVEVVVRGNVTGQCGAFMKGGSLRVEGDAGAHTGKHMAGGSIIINGTEKEG